MLLLILAISCAFLMGYAVNQGSTCSVAAARQLVFDRSGAMFIGFGVAIGSAGLICLPLAWAIGDRAHLSPEAAIAPGLVAGAMLLGVGAVINDACLFGALSRIGQGEVRFLALPIGLGIGFFVAERQAGIHAPTQAHNMLARPSIAAIMVVAVFGALLFAAYRRLASRTRIEEAAPRWPLEIAMVVLGVTGALLFALTPGWTYADALRRSVAPGGASGMIGLGALLAGVAAVGGAIRSGVRAHSFRFQRPTAGDLGRSILGGAVMALGAAAIPGGNDSLLLAAVPGATASGLVAYGVMSATVLALLIFKRSLMRDDRKGTLATPR